MNSEGTKVKVIIGSNVSIEQAEKYLKDSGISNYEISVNDGDVPPVENILKFQEIKKLHVIEPQYPFIEQPSKAEVKKQRRDWRKKYK